ncbi:unnamed protein product [Toxocara canis]|uniref:Col_cuticle_N domain-containing protein n=1 Tax=Toxocara canis TaxID=6265 RepID=A0A183U577_TOXCA|nr:unnamed protein product [Toxocara canis]
MSMKTMAIVAATLGIGTVLSLLIAVSHIVSEIRSIDNELMIEMDSFKVRSYFLSSLLRFSCSSR